MSRKGKGRSVITQIVIAMPVLTVGLSLGTAKLILNGTIGEENLALYSYVISGVISFALSLYCAMRMPQKKALWGIGISGGYAITLLLGNLLFFGVGYGSILPTVGTVLTAGSIGAILGAMKRRHYA